MGEGERARGREWERERGGEGERARGREAEKDRKRYLGPRYNQCGVTRDQR